MGQSFFGSQCNTIMSKLADLTRNPEVWHPPQKFNLISSNDQKQLESMLDDIQVVRDPLLAIIDELYDIEHPAKKGDRKSVTYSEFVKDITSAGEKYGFWFYFQWSKELIRYPKKEDLRKLRTSRNKNLITQKEQDKLYKSTVAVFGLSVGSNVIDSMLLSGVGGKLIIADMDDINPTNLNRIRADFSDINGSKLDYSAKLISKTDPYLEQVHLRNGISPETLTNTVLKHKPDILVDEVDDLSIKVAIRFFAKEHEIPVVMATDVGEKVVLDIERYDIEDIQPLHGKLTEADLKLVTNGSLSQQEIGLIIAQKFIGIDNVSERTVHSLQEVGVSLPAWPQLGETAVMSGLAVSNIIRRILTGEKICSGRQIITF